jgi:hypothetical protein
MSNRQLVMPFGHKPMEHTKGFRDVLKSLSMETLLVLRDQMCIRGESRIMISEVDAEIQIRIK